MDAKTTKKHKGMRAIKVRVMLRVGGADGLCGWDGTHRRGLGWPITFLIWVVVTRVFTSYGCVKLDICSFLYLCEIFFTLKW